MRKLILISLFIFSNSWAMKPLPIVELTPELASELDFRISFEVTADAAAVSLFVPANVDACAYRGSSIEIINSDGKVIASTYNNVNINNDEAHINGYLVDLSLEMRMAVTYICLPNSGKRGKIYMINSIKGYLISSLQ